MLGRSALWLSPLLTLLATRVAAPGLPADSVALPPAVQPVAPSAEPVQVWLPAAESPRSTRAEGPAPVHLEVPMAPTAERERIEALHPAPHRAWARPITRDRTFVTADQPPRVVAPGTPPSGQDDAAR